MPGLKELRVEIEVQRMTNEYWAGNEVRVLEPVALVKQPKVFRVFASWPGGPCSIPDTPHYEITRVRRMEKFSQRAMS